jgi:hypothetical protein
MGVQHTSLDATIQGAGNAASLINTKNCEGMYSTTFLPVKCMRPFKNATALDNTIKNATAPLLTIPSNMGDNKVNCPTYEVGELEPLGERVSQFLDPSTQASVSFVKFYFYVSLARNLNKFYKNTSHTKCGSSLWPLQPEQAGKHQAGASTNA